MFAASKFLADETIDRISNLSSTAWSKLINRSPIAQRSFEKKYEQFLLHELEKIKKRKAQNSSAPDDLRK